MPWSESSTLTSVMRTPSLALVIQIRSRDCTVARPPGAAVGGRMGLPASVSRFVRALRQHGPAGTLRLAQGAVFPDLRFIVLFGLSEPRPLPALGGQVECHFASRDEAAALPAKLLKRDSLALLDRGDRCLVQTIDGRLAGVVWASTGPVVDLHPGLRLGIPPDVVYTYRTWTAPEFRGLGLQGRRHLAVLGALRGEGRSRLLCFSETTNLASLHGVRKSGCEPIGRIRARKAGDARAVLRITAPSWSGVSLAETPQVL